MAPRYTAGDVVVFSPERDTPPGCDCFVRLERDSESTFKRVFFETDERGDIEFINWPSSYADAFPFGPIFIAPVRADLPSTGLYVGSGFVANPSPGGDPYTIYLSGHSAGGNIVALQLLGGQHL